MMRYFLILIFLATASTVFAQDMATARLKWTSNEATDAGQQTFSLPSWWVTRGDSLTWFQGSYAQRFVVQSRKGSWVDVSKTGSIEYTAMLAGDTQPTTVKFERNSAGWQISLNGGTVSYKLKVAQVISLP